MNPFLDVTANEQLSSILPKLAKKSLQTKITAISALNEISDDLAHTDINVLLPYLKDLLLNEEPAIFSKLEIIVRKISKYHDLEDIKPHMILNQIKCDTKYCPDIVKPSELPEIATNITQDFTLETYVQMKLVKLLYTHKHKSTCYEILRDISLNAKSLTDMRFVEWCILKLPKHRFENILLESEDFKSINDHLSCLFLIFYSDLIRESVAYEEFICKIDRDSRIFTNFSSIFNITSHQKDSESKNKDLSKSQRVLFSLFEFLNDKINPDILLLDQKDTKKSPYDSTSVNVAFLLYHYSKFFLKTSPSTFNGPSKNFNNKLVYNVPKSEHLRSLYTKITQKLLHAIKNYSKYLNNDIFKIALLTNITKIDCGHIDANNSYKFTLLYSIIPSKTEFLINYINNVKDPAHLQVLIFGINKISDFMSKLTAEKGNRDADRILQNEHPETLNFLKVNSDCDFHKFNICLQHNVPNMTEEEKNHIIEGLDCDQIIERCHFLKIYVPSKIRNANGQYMLMEDLFTYDEIKNRFKEALCVLPETHFLSMLSFLDNHDLAKFLTKYTHHCTYDRLIKLVELDCFALILKDLNLVQKFVSHEDLLDLLSRVNQQQLFKIYKFYIKSSEKIADDTAFKQNVANDLPPCKDALEKCEQKDKTTESAQNLPKNPCLDALFTFRLFSIPNFEADIIFETQTILSLLDVNFVSTMICKGNVNLKLFVSLIYAYTKNLKPCIDCCSSFFGKFEQTYELSSSESQKTHLALCQVFYDALHRATILFKDQSSDNLSDRLESELIVTNDKSCSRPQENDFLMTKKEFSNVEKQREDNIQFSKTSVFRFLLNLLEEVLHIEKSNSQIELTDSLMSLISSSNTLICLKVLNYLHSRKIVNYWEIKDFFVKFPTIDQYNYFVDIISESNSIEINEFIKKLNDYLKTASILVKKKYCEDENKISGKSTAQPHIDTIVNRTDNDHTVIEKKPLPPHSLYSYTHRLLESSYSLEIDVLENISLLNHKFIKNSLLKYLFRNDLLFGAQIVCSSVNLVEIDEDCRLLTIEFENINDIDTDSLEIIGSLKIDTVHSNSELLRIIEADNSFQKPSITKGKISLPKQNILGCVTTNLSDKECLYRHSKLLNDLSKTKELLLESFTSYQNRIFEFRSKKFLDIISKITSQVSNDFINIFSLSNIQEDALKEELFNLLIEPLRSLSFDFKWMIFLESVHKLRNMSICFFMESLLHLLEYEKFLVNNTDLKLLKLFAFNFPNVFAAKLEQYNNIKSLHSTQKTFKRALPASNVISDISGETYLNTDDHQNPLSKKIQTHKNTFFNPVFDPSTFQINDLLTQEATKKVFQIPFSFKKSTNGFLLKGKYMLEETEFDIDIEINENIRKCAFKTDLYGKDKFLVKINSLLRRSRKFVEVLSLWKINVDNKVLGNAECLICYMVVSQDKTLPDYKCKTCKNSIHKACLRKWLGKKQKAVCPLDRQPL